MSDLFFFPSTGIRVPRAILLAIDDFSLPLRRNLCYYLSKPKVWPRPVLTPSRDNPNAPDYLATHFYGSVLYDEGKPFDGAQGKFRMWYYAVHLGDGPKDLREGPMCYAESDDGIHWVKPALRQFEFKGSLDHNAIKLPELRTEGNFVIKDELDPDPARRYKLVYNYRPPDRSWTIRTATSPDGLHWTAGPEGPFHTFIEHASVYRFNGLFFVSGQMHNRGEGGHAQGRQGHVIVSPDFDHWLQEWGDAFLLPEPADPNQRGSRKPYDQVHIGVGAAPFDNVLVGLYCIWHNRVDFHEISGDLGLLVSNDGFHFREPVKGQVYLSSQDSPVTPGPSGIWPTVLCQAGGILNVGGETRIYHGRWRNSPYGDEYYGEVALATLPRDRWGALGLFPDQAEGSVWSCPVTLPANGCQVILNADRACDMRVEIADERFNLLPAYSGEQSGVTQVEGGLDCPVAWPAGGLERLGGEIVRFRVQVKRQRTSEPRLYAICLRM
jgi:hypothetical protein